MTIGKGTTWGSPGALPPGSPIVDDDQALRVLVVSAMRNGTNLPPIGLAGGSLWRTLGGPSSGRRLGRLGVGQGCSETVGEPDTSLPMHLPVDVIEAHLDGTPSWFVASLVAHDRLRRFWLVAMNAQFVGSYQLGPRAHPGDGLVDVFSGKLGWQELAEVARRATNGAHLPHPSIAVGRVAAHEVEFATRVRVSLDGSSVGSVRHLRLTVLPDAITVVV